MRYSIPQDVLYQELPGEAVVLNLATAEYFHLNGVGHAAWQMIRSGADRQAIDAKLTGEYDASADQIRLDLDRFLKQLVELKLVVQHE
jgi:hypothetical protein